ncbi:hypothetical protein GCM10010912_54320 [Paenibacillus albidus]|uniref:Glycosyl transferase family 1 domain-containing protein n=1 Tax=Paenibacillus albidus TaxID=2041023 RepID=A0A917CZ89_9BACL|nr:glycosyltransferase [Paenibacillus albidus]GGG02651.1 hypothetical protein GCM10010912_54320 [Paenibacillus albidus]
MGALEKRVRTIPYGIDVSQYDAKAQMVSSVIPATGCKVIMYAGRLEYIKGVHVLMLALGMLHNLRQDWICVLAGIGSLEEPLKAQAIELGIAERVVFAGKVDNIPAALAGADLYVQPSLQDTQPYSVTEAQLAGIAPIVSGTAGMPEMVIPGETGWIVPPEDAAALAERLAALLADDQLRARTGRCARKWAASCRSLDVMTARTLQAYHDTIAWHALQQAEGIYHNSLRMAGEAGAASLPGAFHPAEVLQPTEQGKILASILRHRLPADYFIPDARILARFRPSVHE